MRLLCIALPALLLPLCGLASAADWHLSPAFSLNAEYTDNPWLSFQGVEAVRGAYLEASLPLIAKAESAEFQAIADGRVFHYNDRLFDHDDYKLDLSLKDKGERGAFAASGDATYDTTLTSELGTTGLTDINRRHSHYDAAFNQKLQLAEDSLAILDLRGETDHYEDVAMTGLVDYRYGVAVAAYQHQWTQITAVGIGFQAGRLWVPGRPDLATTLEAARFAVTHNFTERFSLEAYGGPAQAQQRAVKTYRSATGQLTLRYGGERTDFSLQVGRQFEPTGYGSVTAQKSAALGLSHRLSEKLSSVTTLSYLDSSYVLGVPGGGAFDVNDWRFDQGLAWKWSETIAISLAISEVRQFVSAMPGHAQRFTANFGVRWTPQVF